MPAQVRASTPKAPVAVYPMPPVTAPPCDQAEASTVATLVLQDGSSYQGISFGAETKSISGECVFQTGMVGYPESLTDPSYRGQILVLTFPLVGNYGVPSRETMDPLLKDLPKHFESNEIHIAGLIVGQYSQDFSHYLATSSLGAWLKEFNIPAIYGIDTRAMTKKIRSQGVMLGKILFPTSVVGPTVIPASEEWMTAYQNVEYVDPNARNLVAEVSLKEPKIYSPEPATAVLGPNGKPLRILAVDVGMKFNQIRCFVARGVEVKVVPWDYDFNADTDYDGLFISNGPGDPTMTKVTIDHLTKALQIARTPIFGICLGHQLLALASGATTKKMKFGNRGHNIPCTDMISGRCYISSQNHGYAVDVATLPENFMELFVNANDGSNEGIMHKTLPIFSVQFHPESTPGPRDTEYLFDVFIKAVDDFRKTGTLKAITMPGGTKEAAAALNPRVSVRKVLVLGSGGLSIGQAGEFDYSGSQAIKALKEEGIYTVLINPNIATIQTSKGLADKVYFLPVTPEFVRKVILREKPDGIYVTFGGQTALSVGIKMKDEFAGLGVRVLGTPIETIIATEDREIFAQRMLSIGEKIAQAQTAVNLQEAIDAANEIGYPVICRAAFALGGLGSGFANNDEELSELVSRAFATSPQVLIERSMKGWKEIEYEVVRDCRDNCITVCNMENFDPLGIHTGDSIVVAPSQTLSDEDYNMLRTTAVNVIRHLGVVGECNIQYALNPFSKEYCIIEVNARLSRSSALASKATGYPLAFVAAKLGLNIPLNEISNSVTKVTCACFEPSLDYVVVKMPRWDLAKFDRVSKALSSSMKSVGEVMAIGRTFEETIQKAIRAIDPSLVGFAPKESYPVIDDELMNPNDQRVFAIANAMNQGYSVDRIWELTKIDKWFLNKLQNIVRLDKTLGNFTASDVPTSMLRSAKQLGFSDRQIATAISSNELSVRRLRTDAGIIPFVKQIDTVAAEFPAFTNYLYMTYNAVEHDVTFEDKGVMVLGSGVYRIGSSVEFDWCAVRAIRTLRGRGVKTVMVNYNPETVSTDYDEADRLYFENINLERILDIYEAETSSGVVIAMGGQTPNNIALPLHRQNVKILGTSPEMIDTAENRYKFSRMLDQINVDQPLWKELTSFDEAGEFCEKVGYPVLVRPSYVLSGAAMNVVYSPDDLSNYLGQATAVSRDHPVVISKYIEDAKEIEMDAIAVNGKMVMHVVSEHVENAGVHSGDATLILPPQDLDPETIRKIEVATAKIGQALDVTGCYNIQFIAKDNEIKVIECNLRASRSMPFVSKVMEVDLIEMATNAMLGFPVEAYPESPIPKSGYVGIKVPQFSFSRLSGADPILGVEMASTGEVACFGKDKYEAYIKALVSTGFTLPKKNVLLSIGSFKEKQEMLPAVKRLRTLGYNLFATAGTADFMSEHGVPVKYLETLEDDNDSQKSEYSLNQHLANNLIDLYINLPSKNRYRRPASYVSKGYRTRRMAVDFSVPLITNVKCAKLFVEALARHKDFEIDAVDYKDSNRTITLPGLVNIQTLIPGISTAASKDFDNVSRTAISSGFTMIGAMATGIPKGVEDKATLAIATTNTRNHAHCDFFLSQNANVDNASDCLKETSALFIPFAPIAGRAIANVAEAAKHFSSWPAGSPIVTDAKGTDLASILLLASLHNRPVHITGVSSADDMALIMMSKDKELQVTCDIEVYSLFLTREETGSKLLPTKAEQDAFWSSVHVFDCFTVGSLPYRLAAEKGTPLAHAGIEETLPLLVDAVNKGRLTMADVIAKLYTNPRKIFSLPEQKDSYVEIETDRACVLSSTSGPFAGKALSGTVHRVVLHGQTAYLDGAWYTTGSEGQDVSSVAQAITKAVEKVVHPAAISTSAVMHSPRLGPSPDVVPATPTRATEARRSSVLLEAAPVNIPQAISSVVKEMPSSIARIINNSPFSHRHILSSKQFDRNELHALFSLAHEMRTQVERNGSIDLLRGKVMCSMFYEPSTRTSCSFAAAMARLGGSVVSADGSSSSVVKGETLADTVRTLGCYGDLIVLRHPDPGSAATAAKFSKVPVINAGDGIGEHPTQAFLDVYTIREELGTVNGLTITLVGDLKNGRTVHSLVKLLAYYHVTLNFVSPPSLRMPESVKAELSQAGVIINEYTDLNDVIAESDVVYVTRVQKERFSDLEEYERVKSAYIINNKMMSKAKTQMVVMHPLPRVSEIEPEVDFDQRAAYFRQMRYGLYVRMALLALVSATL
ncbi:hypothetical protein BG003_006316 [Podila horticola]|nr:hypothetical protein BG003_006316 [Podila horticola]